MPIKVLTILGTRPEIIKLSLIMKELEKHIQHVLVHTGQNYDYELNEIFFNEMEIRKPDYFLDAVGDNLAETIGNIISKVDKVLEKEKPDAVLVYGDTNSCLSVIPAKRRKIPIFHMEAGNRCFDARVPEEANRKIIDHTSDINMTITEHARRYLIQEGIRPETIIKTGSPMIEILEYYKEKIKKSTILQNLNIEPENFFLVSAHREENIDSEINFNDLLDTLNGIAEKYQKPIIVSTHPRTRKRIELQGNVNFNPLIRFMKPLGFLDYVKLQMEAKCVISDSGTITEEGTILNIPVVTLRQAHERPEGMDEGTLIMSDPKREDVLAAMDTVMAQHSKIERIFRVVPDYDVKNVSKKTVRIIMSYIRYINRTVWYKDEKSNSSNNLISNAVLKQQNGMLQKICILGCSGMLGSMILDVFAKDSNYEIIAVVRDISYAESQKNKYSNVKWQILDAEKATEHDIAEIIADCKWVINAIGVIKPYIKDTEDQQVERAIKVNALFPHLLAKVAKTKGTKVIQIATDCVYSGQKGSYKESDSHDSIDAYGKTKGLGEANNASFYNLRCSIIGPETKNNVSLLDWFLGQPANGQLNGFTNHHWNGITTLHFAKICIGIVKSDMNLPNKQHIIPANKISKHNLLLTFSTNFDRSDLKINPVPADTVIDRTLATENSANNLRIWQAAGYNEPPTIEKMVEELALLINKNNN